MAEEPREPLSFPVTARTIARHLDHLVRQLGGPFEEELNGLQERSRTMAVMHLQSAASQLGEFADVEWLPRSEPPESPGSAGTGSAAPGAAGTGSANPGSPTTASPSTEPDNGEPRTGEPGADGSEGDGEAGGAGDPGTAGSPGPDPRGPH